MKLFKSTLSLAIALLILISMTSVVIVGAKDAELADVGAWNTSYTSKLNGDPFNDITEIALAQEYKTAADLGLSGQWCARFVSECASIAGQSTAIPYNAAVSYMYNSVIAAGGYEVSSPQKGDLVFFHNGNKSKLGHVGFATDSTHNVSGNIAYNGATPSKVYILKNSSEGYSNWFYVRPAYSGSVPPVEYASITNGEYYLKNVATGKYLAVDGGKDAQAQNVSVADYTGGNEMKFSVVSESNGYALRPLCSASRMLNIYATNVVSGKNVCIYDNTGHSSQRWRFEAVDGGYIIHSSNNTSCVLDVSGTNVQVSNKSGANSQKWVLEPIKLAVLPDKPTLEVVPGTQKVDTVFMWVETANTDSYTLHLYDETKGEKYPLFSDITDLSIAISLPAGNYSAFVASINDDLKGTNLWYTVSDAVTFSVEDTHEHEYYIIEEAEHCCQSYGYTKYECECGDVYTETGTELGEHVASDEWTVLKMPTETSYGIACKLCVACPVQVEYATIDINGNIISSDDEPSTETQPPVPDHTDEPSTETLPSVPDYPLGYEMDAYIADESTGDVMFNWSAHSGAAYYNIRILNSDLQEIVNENVEEPYYLWSPITSEHGMLSVASYDANGKMFAESSLVTYNISLIAMGDWWGEYGDVDCNSKVNIKDATLIQKYLSKLADIGEAGLGAADVNSDEKINIKDATAIQKYLASISTDTKVGEFYHYYFTDYEITLET